MNSKIKSLIVLAVLVILSTSSYAQQTETRKAQVSFLYPIGTNGTATNISNDYSFNMLAGVNGGVNKFEIGGLANINTGSVTGFQLAGLANVNTGYSSGFLISGIANVVTDGTSGFMLSGIGNYVEGNSSGFQLSGIANINKGNFSGLQLGLVNAAKELKGVQFGLINYAESAENGVPIGLFSVVKKGGFRRIEFTTGETLYANLSYKMGVRRFYTIYKVGASSYKDKSVFSYGLGFGTLIDFGDKHHMSIDLTANQIVHDGDFSDKINILSRLDLNYEYALNDRFSLIAGPSLNTYVTKQKVDGSENFGTIHTPGSFYSKKGTNSSKFMWIGFNAGISMRL